MTHHSRPRALLAALGLLAAALVLACGGDDGAAGAASPEGLRSGADPSGPGR